MLVKVELQMSYVCVCCRTLSRSNCFAFFSISSPLPSISLYLHAPSSHRFRSKYHPDEVGRHKQESLAALRNRLNAFLYLMDNGWLTEILLDVDKAPSIIKVLDAGNAECSFVF